MTAHRNDARHTTQHGPQPEAGNQQTERPHASNEVRSEDSKDILREVPCDYHNWGGGEERPSHRDAVNPMHFIGPPTAKPCGESRKAARVNCDQRYHGDPRDPCYGPEDSDLGTASKSCEHYNVDTQHD